MLHLQLYLRLGLKLKQIRRVLEFNQPQWLKPYAEFNTKKRLEAEKHGSKNRKALYRLMSTALYGETMENLRNRIDVRLVSNKRDHLKWTSKSNYMSQKIFDNDLVAIRKSKVTLSLNFSAYIGIYILDLTKVSIYEFHCDYFENKYVNNTRPLFIDTHSLMYEIKPKNVYEDFSKDKEMFDFSNYSPKSKYCDDSNKLAVGKMRDKAGDFAIKEFVGLNPKMYSFLVDDSSEHKKAKDVNKNVVQKITYNEHKDVFLNRRKVRHSMNRIQNKDSKNGTYEINNFFLSCFDDKIHILNNGYDG